MFILFERSLKELPGSYKLWKLYLNLRKSFVLSLPLSTHESDYLSLNDCFERSLILLNKVFIFNLFRCLDYG